jgi:hypothetical protein
MKSAEHSSNGLGSMSVSALRMLTFVTPPEVSNNFMTSPSVRPVDDGHYLMWMNTGSRMVP